MSQTWPLPGVAVTYSITTTGPVDPEICTIARGGISFQISGTWSGTLQFEGTVDGTSWIPIQARFQDTVGTLTTDYSTTVNGIAAIGASPYSFVRLNVGVVGFSGAIAVTAKTSLYVPSFAGAMAGGGAVVQRFVTSGTWTKPGMNSAGMPPTMFYVLCIGEGGGGGSGARSSPQDISGGGGGGGGARSWTWFLPSDLGATEIVTIGTGAVGGPSQTELSTGGNGGTNGIDTSFGIRLRAGGGQGGQGGLIFGSTPGGLGGTGTLIGATGSDGGFADVGTPGTAGTVGGGGAGGAGGGGITVVGPLAFDGGDGPAPYALPSAPIPGGVVPGGDGAAGPSSPEDVGLSGGGGAGSTVGAGGDGGTSGSYGAGGSGGGASLDDGGPSGAGADGSGGLVLVFTWY